MYALCIVRHTDGCETQSCELVDEIIKTQEEITVATLFRLVLGNSIFSYDHNNDQPHFISKISRMIFPSTLSKILSHKGIHTIHTILPLRYRHKSTVYIVQHSRKTANLSPFTTFWIKWKSGPIFVNVTNSYRICTTVQKVVK